MWAGAAGCRTSSTVPTSQATSGSAPTDSVGGPEPDNAHLTGVILRLNSDGTTPVDNPFSEIGHVFVARLEGSQEFPANTSSAKGYAAFIMDRAMTSLSFIVTVNGLDFTGAKPPTQATTWWRPTSTPRPHAG